MATNPLQQYFRQPKIFISLPSQGIYNKPGSIAVDPSRIPVFGMTGMDEILLKTPDALLAGESTVSVIQSCCPGIADAWDLSSLDIDLVLAAVRIATYGSELTIRNTCSKCETENEYSIGLSKLIDHYATCQYDNKLVLDQLTIIVKPLCYKQTTDFGIRNFQLQQRLGQTSQLDEGDDKSKSMNSIFQDLSKLRNEVFASGIESVNTGTVVVTERAYIAEWLDNVDRSVVDSIRKHIEQNQRKWASPVHEVKCDSCEHEDEVTIDLDQSNFFVNA